VTWAEFKAFISIFGVPGAMLFTAIVLIYKGYFIRKGEFDRLLEEYVRMTKERDEWKELALKNWQQAERFMTTTQQATETAAKALGKI
jgi:hypothetical protein